MFSELGAVAQIAYAVNDLDKAVANWNALGVGPFFILRDIQYIEQTYRGVPTACRASAAFAYFGDLQIELLQPLNDEPSAAKEFLDQHSPGMQHIGIICKDVPAATEKLLAQGYEIVQRMVSKTGVETVLFDTEVEGTSVLELIQESPELLEGFAQIKAAAKAWDRLTPGAIEVNS